MKIVLGCTVEAIASRLDGTLKFTLGANEMDAVQAGSLFQLRGKFIKVLLSDNNISPIEEKLVEEESMTGGKKARTPGQRLRSVMYIVHLNQGIQMDFDQWYKAEMETLITKYKDLLND